MGQAEGREDTKTGWDETGQVGEIRQQLEMVHVIQSDPRRPTHHAPSHEKGRKSRSSTRLMEGFFSSSSDLAIL